MEVVNVDVIDYSCLFKTCSDYHDLCLNDKWKCCACMDKRIHEVSYKRYVDGKGVLFDGCRNDFYCSNCKVNYQHRSDFETFMTNSQNTTDDPRDLYYDYVLWMGKNKPYSYKKFLSQFKSMKTHNFETRKIARESAEQSTAEQSEDSDMEESVDDGEGGKGEGGWQGSEYNDSDCMIIS